jgi:Omp85 superfamily domain/Surface antigen variable number repeat
LEASQPALRRLYVTRSKSRAGFALALLSGFSLALPLPVVAQPPAKPPSTAPSNELDAFMEKALKRREVNRQILEQYVLDEVEQIEVLGPGRMPLFRQKHEFTWYVRDGLHVRSPVRFDGVSVDEEARKQYEENWARRERGRLERQKKKDGKVDEPPPEPDQQAMPGGATPIPTPRFVSEAYFMEFKFEPGNYYLAGREQLEGQEVLRIEYYPKRMFSDDPSDDPPRKPRNDRQERRDKELEQRIERQMNKTALITLWVDPKEHQIVKYTFDNVWMDFLPAGWLVKVDDIRASMTMGQPFPGVWLPREMNIHAGVTFAAGSLEAGYERTFSDYKQADVKSRIKIPKAPDRNPDLFPEHSSDAGSGPFVPADTQAAQSQEIISEIRVHGNAYVRDDEVIRLSGVAVGQPLGANTLQEIEQRLKATGHFETVEVHKRYRSLNMTNVAIVLLVHERPGRTSETIDAPGSRPFGWLTRRLMFLPILSYADGYGFTYGGRVSTVDLLGAKERLSVPLTWGGTRRAALEFERTFKSGPLTRVESSFGIWQRENPRFELDDQRVEWKARAERSFAHLVRLGVDTSQSTVEFGDLDDRLWTVGADALFDTRGDPTFPRNAVLLGAGWSSLNVRGLDAINRYTADARGYVGVIRQAVLAARVQYSAADKTLPPYERLLLGGASNLRGFGTGAFDGDRMFVTSAELRVPITSVLSGAKLGVTAFYDAGKAFNVGQRLQDATWRQGVGGGVFLIATIVRINLDVAHGLRDGDTRVHLSSGFSF